MTDTAGGSAGEQWEAHYNPDVGWNIWEGGSLVFTVFTTGGRLPGDTLEAKMARDRALALGIAADHNAALERPQPSAGAAEGERWEKRAIVEQPDVGLWVPIFSVAPNRGDYFLAMAADGDVADAILAARAQATRVADLELYKQATNSPYGECFTLPDGDCVGRGCMHDPQAQRVKALETALRYYGRHKELCPAIWGFNGTYQRECDCGFAEALALLATPEAGS